MLFCLLTPILSPLSSPASLLSPLQSLVAAAREFQQSTVAAELQVAHP
jgi:hypothetical protein